MAKKLSAAGPFCAIIESRRDYSGGGVRAMKTRLAVCITVIILSCSATYAATLTFDQVPSGTRIRGSEYADSHRIFPSDDFIATDHTGFQWGPPRSGRNVLTSVGNPYVNPSIMFGYYTTSIVDPDPVLSVSAYFSTRTDTIIRVTPYLYVGYRWVPAASVEIGTLGESWDNRFVEISTTPDLPISIIAFEGVSSPDDLLGFCLDDMTITLIPEPSSLLALGGGLGALGLLHRRRK